jgi:4-amino-4-deoxy-L-arabinose transferase-like glycosyltransferase
MPPAHGPLGRMSSNPWIIGILLGIATLAIDLPAIGVGDFVGDDEALDAGVVWEMRHSGDWLFPEFNGEYLPPKPPLFYWAAATASILHGEVDEWSLRVPSAVAGAATVTITVARGAAMIGSSPAAFAGAMLATMPMVFRQARSGRCDMLLTLLVTGCLLIASMPGEISRSARWTFWSLLALAALVKGGAGVGLVVFVILAAALANRDPSLATRWIDRSMTAFFVIAAPWYLAATAHWGSRFVDEQIIGENLHHLFGGSGISDKGTGTTPLAVHATYYLLQFFPQTAPWGLLVPLALRDLWRGEQRNLRFFAVWLVAGVVFFTFVSRKSPYYLLPLLPSVALLAGGWMFGDTRQEASWRFDLGSSLRTSIFVVGGSVLVWLAARSISSTSCDVRAGAQALAERPVVTIFCATVLGVGGLAASQASRRREWTGAVISLAVALAGLLVLSGRISGRIDDCASLRPFADQVREKTTADDRLMFFESPLPAVVLYAERRIPTLHRGQEPPRSPFYLIVPQSLDAVVPPEWRQQAEVVARGHGRVFTRKRMDISLLRVDSSTSGDEGDDVPLGGSVPVQEVRYP